ncbi:MAG: MaoC/PaaZ C-terminal domain-containing protein [Gammaproteobacteria bacterium]
MSADDRLFFDDLEPGARFQFGPYAVSRDELLAFNRRWDPLPIHLDDAAARARGFDGLTASGQYTLCVKQRLLNEAPWTDAVVGALGFDELRFPHPVYPGDSLSLDIECLSARPSASKPDRGIVEFLFRLSNQDGVEVLRYLDTVMFLRR